MRPSAIKRFHRLMLESWIEDMIRLLDQMDGDPDLEDDELEDENEHGGEVTDEPHDHSDSGDDELTLGWPEQITQRGIEMPEPFSANYDTDDSHADYGGPRSLGFDGSGYRKAKDELARLQRRRPDIHQAHVGFRRVMATGGVRNALAPFTPQSLLAMAGAGLLQTC